LLPEGPRLDALLDSRPGLKRGDLVGLLRAVGADVAGSLVLPGPEVTRLGPVLGAQEVSQEVSAPSSYIGGGGSTTAGLQPKVTLGRSDAGWHAARDGHPSTHIVKPANPDSRRSAVAEVWIMQLARRAGLLDYDVWLEQFGSTTAVVVERYDRVVENGHVRRIHQEDGAQALGLPWGGDAKFEREGAGASYRAIARLLDRDRTVFAQGMSDRERLLQQLAFRMLVGDTDGHAKNHALLHHEEGRVTLAPLYDATPVVLYGGGAGLALSVAGRRYLSEIDANAMVLEAHGWGVSASVARHTVLDLAERVLEAARDMGADPEIEAHLPGYVTRAAKAVLEGRPAGLGLGEFPTLEPLAVV
jgi:serine/threonine-protein kinase HipA